MDMMQRREFIGGAFATLGMTALGAPKPPAPKPPAPKLILGAISDVHVRVPGWKNQSFDTTQFHAALEWFRGQNVDGVIIAGDLADNGQAAPLEGMAEAWFDVFPKRKSKVEKLFVSGNHDWWGQRDVAKMDKLWTHAWDEQYKSLWMKRVKGYAIIGQQWENYEPCDNAPYDKIVPWLKAHKFELGTKKPFFYVQHPHLKGTCYRTGGWGRDRGITTGALSAFPNAIAISGHSHHSVTRKHAFWHGAFTAVPTSSLRYRQQGLLIKVFDDKVVFERHHFGRNGSLGAPWVQGFPKS